MLRLKEPVGGEVSVRAAVRRIDMSIDDFLVWESRQEVRNELVGGEIFAMLDGTIGHALITQNIATVLDTQWPRRSGVLTHAMKVRVEASNSVYYPDVVVSCTPQDRKGIVLRDPILVVEVLSESTASFDRRTKRRDYLTIPTMAYVLLVDADARHVELERRDPDGGWTRETVTGEGTLELETLGIGLSLDDIYGHVLPSLE